jgi:ABC-type phosphate transport system ATPase subunit
MLMRCVKRRDGFQKQTQKTIYENVAYGLRVNGITDKNEIEERVVTTIEQVALWDEVKDKLKNQLLNFLEVNNNGYVLPVLSQLSLFY